MTARLSTVCLPVLLGLISCGNAAQAQLFRRAASNPAVSAPTISAILPPGVTVGRASEIQVKGQNLSKVEQWLFSVPGVEVREVKESADNSATLLVMASRESPSGLCELRALARGGLSNLALLSVDTLPQSLEKPEPNGHPEKATPLAWDSVVGGILTAQDVDCYRIEAHKGQRGLFEVEAQRLGTAIDPVLTLIGPDGVSLEQARASKGFGRDARLVFTFPEDGLYYLQVHDNIYAGNDAAAYRLRARDNGRFATALFPLGGPAGWTVQVEASGGNLDAPRTAFVPLPDEPGKLIDPPPFPGEGGSVVAPMRLVVGGSDRDEILERKGAEFTPIVPGQAVCGRIDRPGEVDRYRITSKTASTIELKVRAAELGSWLDSVVRVLDAEGKEVARNDDPGGDNSNFQPFNGQPPAPADSRLSFQMPGDGRPFSIEIYDRYGDGGPEYAYRLETGPSHPEFHISLIVDPNRNNRRNVFGGRGTNPALPGSSGSLNLTPGSSTTLNFLVTGTGPLEPIEVSAEGLPFGVSADSVTIRSGTMRTSRSALPPSGGALTLKVAPGASAGLGSLRIVGRSRTIEGLPMKQVATAEVIIDTPVYQNIYQPPITRELTEIPLWIVGDTRDAEHRPGFVGPPRPIALALKEVENPGILLQGAYVDLGLMIDPADAPPGSYMLEGTVEGSGLGVQTLVTETGGSMPDEEQPSAIVRVVAAPDARPGARKVTLTVKTVKGEPIRSEQLVDIQVPIRLEVSDSPVEIGAETTASLNVSVERRKGADGPIDLKLALPPGVRVADRRTLTIPRNEIRTAIPLGLDPGAEPPDEPKPVVVTGKIRMPRGSVKVEAAVRPMLSGVSAEK
jgi:hypothetical protein